MDVKKFAMEDAAQMCPFLRNVSLSSNPLARMFSPSSAPSVEPAPGAKGPIFEETSSSFEVAFKMFHGQTGVVPLAKYGDDSSNQSPSDVLTVGSSIIPRAEKETSSASDASVCPYASAFAGGLGASAATISLSVFGPYGPFSYDSFRSRSEDSKEQQRRKKEEEERKRREAEALEEPAHEAMGDEWLATGNCPIAKSYRAFSRVLPLLAAAVRPATQMQYRCPPAIVALRAAVAKTSAMKALRPQALPIKTLAIGTIGLMLNIPLGVWREHCEKFSPQWILAVHASVPLVAVLRKAALMPQYAMAFTIAAAVLGQAVGARMERKRLRKAGEAKDGSVGADGAAVVAGYAGSSSSSSSSSSGVRGVKAVASPTLPARRRPGLATRKGRQDAWSGAIGFGMASGGRDVGEGSTKDGVSLSAAGLVGSCGSTPLVAVAAQ